MRKLRHFYEINRAALSSIAVGVAFACIGVFANKWPLPLAVASAVFVAAFCFIYTLPQQRLGKLALKSYHAVPTGLGLLSGLYFAWYIENSGIEVPGAFFEVTAQIIPVLILAATVDARRTQQIPTDELVPTLVILVGGEVMALFGILAPNAATFAIICGSLTAGFTALILSILAEGVNAASVSAERPKTNEVEEPEANPLGWPT